MRNPEGIETRKEIVRERVVDRPVPTPEAPKDDPKKLQAASALFSSAEQWMKQEKWKEAMADLQRLNKEHDGLQYTQQHAADHKEQSSCPPGPL